ncbi:MAG: hypothetical protein J6Z11_01885 [Candidatus Riflebacteria bacterium]|nr:hypothetical protein [Candidatus Riflebacteria bacterium]
MKLFKLLFFIALILVSSSLFAQNNTDFLNIGNKITFFGEDFYFGYSSNPIKNYYFEEFFPKGDNPERFNKMFTVTIFLNENANPKEATVAKISEIEQRKQIDPVCNYVVYENDNEFILDFLVSKSEGENIDFVEHNVHHYKQISINGNNGIQINFYSHRAYGDDITPFLKNLKTEKENIIMDLTKMNIDCSLK